MSIVDLPSINPDKEFRALGIANLASALSQGFAVSGADSRTAVNDNAGGKTQLVSIIAAVIIAIIALFLTAPLEYIPSAALGIVLIIASIHLIDLKALWQLKFKDKQAFYLALTTLFAVLFIGVIPGITLAVLLGLFQFSSLYLFLNQKLKQKTNTKIFFLCQNTTCRLSILWRNNHF